MSMRLLVAASLLLLIGAGCESQTTTQTELDTTAEPAVVNLTPPIPEPDPEAPKPSTANVKVTNVVDGDTLDVSIGGEVKRIRLIGVDTPETKDPRKPVQCFGEQASSFTTKTLLNKNVTLEADPSQGELDKYERLLRYVFLEDGRNFNELLVREGYAYEYTYDEPYKYQILFKEAQKDAERNKRGLWAPDTCSGDTTSAASAPTPIPAPSPTPTPTPVVSPTPAPAPSNPPTAVCDCSANTLNCDDFSGHSSAQACFDYCWGKTGRDVHGLDRDKDGEACES